MPCTIFAVKYPVINYQTSDGLPQNQVNALIQDRLGYIIVGTQSGIGKFDGTSFGVLTKKHGLPNNSINDFVVDGVGNLWVATEGGLARIDRTNRIKSYLKDEGIRALAHDPGADMLWIITTTGEVRHRKYDSESETFSPHKILNIKYRPRNAAHQIKGLVVTDRDTRFFYSKKQILKLVKGRVQVVDSPFPVNFLKKLEDTIVVGTTKGLFQLEGDRFISYIDLPADSRDVRDIAREESGRTWVGTQNGLLVYPGPESNPFRINDRNGLSARRIHKIMIDREKIIFVATQWGLSQLSPNLFKMYDETDGLPHKIVWGFEEDHGKILVACDRGIARLNPETGTIKAFDAINRRLKDYSIRTILKYGEKDFLLGTKANGIYRWNGAEGLDRIHDTARVFSVLKMPDQTVWFGTARGLLKYDGRTFTRFGTGRGDPNIWALALLDHETLLVGTSKGIRTFHKGEFVVSKLETLIPGDTLVNDIKVISADEILVATELNGLYVYSGGQLQHFTRELGLSHNDIWSVIKDDVGSTWINTSISLDRYNDNVISHFSKNTGLFGQEGAIHACFKSRNGNIYFGIIPGFIELPRRQPTYQVDPPILYTKEIKINGDDYPLGGQNAIGLPYNRNNVEFHYIAVTTRRENPVYYRTRLVPLESEWSPQTQQTHIKYLNLPPDDYRFEVMASNGAGGGDQWVRERNRVLLSIAKPFWLTWWFILFEVVMGLLVVFVIVKIRLKSLEKQKKRLENQVRERTEELTYLTITDPLTDLKNRRYLEEKIKEDIALIERNIFDLNCSRLKPDQRSGIISRLGVFIVDIDHFKEVNDSYGHNAGDIIIVSIARKLLDMLRDSDTIIRWGGEEFLIIARQSANDKSFEMAERIRQSIAAQSFKLDDETAISKTISVGFCHFPFVSRQSGPATWPQVVSLADSALYIAKNSGRNCCVGIGCGERIAESDNGFKHVVSDIKMGLDKKYLKLIGPPERELVVSQHKRC